VAIRFHLDEHIDPAVALALGRRGVDVSTSQQANLLGADDASQLQFAHDQSCVLVTHDADFLRMHAAGAAHSGIVFSQRGLRSTGDLVKGRLLIHGVMDEEEMAGHVEFL